MVMKTVLIWGIVVDCDSYGGFSDSNSLNIQCMPTVRNVDHCTLQKWYGASPLYLWYVAVTVHSCIEGNFPLSFYHGPKDIIWKS